MRTDNRYNVISANGTLIGGIYADTLGDATLYAQSEFAGYPFAVRTTDTVVMYCNDKPATIVAKGEPGTGRVLIRIIGERSSFWTDTNLIRPV